MFLIALPIAAAAMILTYVASYHVLKTHTAFGSPRLIAAIVAALSGIGLLSLGESIVMLILIPYAAVGLSLLFLLLLKWLESARAERDLARGFDEHFPGRPCRRSDGPCQPRNLRASRPAPLRETPPTEE